MIDTSEKLAGVLMPAFALRRDDDLGIGDTASIIDAIDFCVDTNAAVLQLLPINETGGDNSPYNAISSVALDPVYLTMTPDMVPGLTPDDLSQVAPPEILSQVRTGPVNYQVVKRLKLDLLQAAFRRFRQASQWHADFETFKQEQQNWLDNYTLFRTLIDVNNGDAVWTSWDERLRRPDSARQWLAAQDNAGDLDLKLDFYAFAQWVALRQWQAVRDHADKKKVGLMGDIPFGISRYSADVWCNQHLFDLEWAGGAPPEPFFQDDKFVVKWGQNWGLPLYHWQEHKSEDFRWWKQRVAKVTEIFHYFRIDHVLGFFRIYSFPWLPERNGEFVDLNQEAARAKTGGRLPQFMPRSDERQHDAEQNCQEGQALLSVIVDAAGQAGVVAEDLGVVPNYVRPLLQQMGIPGFTIPYWERTADRELKPKDELPALSLATWATHDHMPLVLIYEDMVRRWHGPNGHDGWLEMQRLMRFLGLDDQQPPELYTEGMHEAFLKSLMETPCWLIVCMITELLASTERFNQPGTSGASNWSRRLDHPLSWYRKNPPFQGRIETFARLVKETRRLPHAWQVGTISKDKTGR